MKHYDIDKLFSEKVLEYLMDGYVISSRTMTGHQGEEGKVDLMKGDELIRIYMDSESSKFSMDINEWSGNIFYLRVGRWKYPASAARTSWPTVWMQDLDILEEKVFYEITKQWYIEDKDEAIRIRKLRFDRFRIQSAGTCDYRYYGEEAYDIAVRYLKRVKGYKRISRDNLKVQRYRYFDQTQYSIIYYNQTFVLR